MTSDPDAARAAAKPAKKAKRVRPPMRTRDEIGETPMNGREAAFYIIGCSEGTFSRMKEIWKAKRTETSSDHKPRYEQPHLRDIRRRIDAGELTADEQPAHVATGSTISDPMPQGADVSPEMRAAYVYDLPPEQRAAYTPDANGLLPDGRISSFIIGPDGKLAPPGYIYLANGQMVHELDWIMKRKGYDEKDLYNPWV